MAYLISISVRDENEYSGSVGFFIAPRSFFIPNDENIQLITDGTRKLGNVRSTRAGDFRRKTVGVRHPPCSPRGRGGHLTMFDPEDGELRERKLSTRRRVAARTNVPKV